MKNEETAENAGTGRRGCDVAPPEEHANNHWGAFSTNMSPLTRLEAVLNFSFKGTMIGFGICFRSRYATQEGIGPIIPWAEATRLPAYSRYATSENSGSRSIMRRTGPSMGRSGRGFIRVFDF